MQLTTFSDFAFRVLMYVEAADDRLVTIEEIAVSYGVSRAHLMKVVNALTRAGYLEAVRGRSGGLKLGKPAETIRLGEVLRVTEPDFALVECYRTGSQCVVKGCCRLPTILRRALDAFLAELDSHSLADLALRPRDFREIFGEIERPAARER